MLDTNIVIALLNHEGDVVEFLEKEKSDSAVTISAIVEAEVLAWSELDDRARQEVQVFLETRFALIPVDRAIARIAATIRRCYGLKLPDACIAATAIHTKTRLLTRNIKDFLRVKELRVQMI